MDLDHLFFTMPAAAQDLLKILVEEAKLSAEQAEGANTESVNTGRSIEEVLTRKHLVSDDDLIRGRAKSLGIPFVTLSTRAISPDVINFIPEPVARRYTLVPFQFDPKTGELSVAMFDPLDFQVIEFLEKKSAKTIKPFMAKKDDVVETMR